VITEDTVRKTRDFGISAFRYSGDRRARTLDIWVREITKPENPFSAKGRGHIWEARVEGHCWWPRGGEISCPMHVCAGGVFKEGLVDRMLRFR
jgi:hypothetical protein